MGTPNPANFNLFTTTVSTILGSLYEKDKLEAFWRQVCDETPADGEAIVFGWTGLMPKMRLWTGARQPHQPAAQTYTVIPQPFENTYSLDRFKYDDDEYDVFYRELPDMTRQAARHPSYQLRDLLENTGVQTGTRQNGTDGLTNFNQSHLVNIYDSSQGTYSNDFTGGGQTIGGVLIGGVLSQTAIASAAEYTTTIKGEDGERLGVKMTHLMHPSTLQNEVDLYLKSMFFSPPSWGGYQPATGQVGAADNPLMKMGIQPLCNDFLNLTTRWYGLDLSQARKPFQRVVREAVKTVPRVSETDDNMFNNHMMQWGQWLRDCPAWQLPWMAFRSGS